MLSPRLRDSSYRKAAYLGISPVPVLVVSPVAVAVAVHVAVVSVQAGQVVDLGLGRLDLLQDRQLISVAELLHRHPAPLLAVVVELGVGGGVGNGGGIPGDRVEGGRVHD